MEDEDPYAQIEQKIDSVVNGRIYNFNGISVRSTSPMSYIRTLPPDSRLLAMTIVLRLLEFFALSTERRKELQNSDSLITNKIQF